ncbi:hypothetical protein [Microvirga makkahensis]|uniref:Uncharacterized protein n=1 Tax=Microvirga makkahensis TaxID=1128670 RepID=A0A7X3MSE0_9HYPH|nr:hypothetical protein [Microvirga makkahensis]MXQ12271.1 hypothetical protein [Microvirga makkahensis]
MGQLLTNWGSAAAAILGRAASMIVAWYVARFDSDNSTYGPLDAELDAGMAHQTGRDSTNGPPRPLGSRGANMAHHVGASQT